MARVLISNIGYRPMVLTRFMAFGEKSSFSMGIDDEPAAMFGKEDQKFPTLLAPGETLKIHPISLAALERNISKPEDDKTFHDPYKYFAVIDSFNVLHPIDADHLRFNLRLTHQFVRPKWWQRPWHWVSRWRFLRKARQSMKL